MVLQMATGNKKKVGQYPCSGCDKKVFEKDKGIPCAICDKTGGM